MTFTPLVPLGGYSGWRFLTRTLPRQSQAFAASRVNQASEAHFRDKIGAVRSAEDLLGDRRLLDFALKAFGLGDDINSRAFIRKVLESPTGDPGALANRLADHRYRDLARAFGFGDPGGPRTTTTAAVDRIVARWRQENFETAIGDANPDMRIALNAQNEIGAIARSAATPDARWYSVLGSAPLREFMQTALGLPSSFARLDLDTQLATFRKRLSALTGDGEVAQLAKPESMERLVQNFFLRRDQSAAGAGGSSAALTLLQGAARGLSLRL